VPLLANSSLTGGPILSLSDQLERMNLLMRYGLWPSKEIPDFDTQGNFVIPAPDMPDLGFPKPDPNLTEPGAEFRGFYGPGPAQEPLPIPAPKPAGILPGGSQMPAPNSFDLTELGRLKDIPSLIRGMGVPYTPPAVPGQPPAVGGGGISLQTLLPLLQALRAWAIPATGAAAPAAAPALASMAMGGSQGPAAFQGANYTRMLNAQGQPVATTPGATTPGAGSALMQLLRQRLLARQGQPGVTAPAAGGY